MDQGKTVRYCGYVEPGKRFRGAAVMWSLEAAVRCCGGAGPGKEVFVNSKNRLTEVWR